MPTIINNILGRNGMRLVGGKIKSISEGTGLAAGKVVNLTLVDGTQIAFWNNESRQMASRIRLAKVKVGSFISVLAMFKEDNKANAINFKYNGVWDFTENISSIKATTEGKIINIDTLADEVRVSLDNASVVSFKNIEKGYKFADRFNERKPAIGNTLSVSEQSGKMMNFAIDGKWEITRSISAVIGNVAFIDESRTAKGDPRIKVNISIFDHKDAKTGENFYRNCYVYFDNENNPNMVDSVKQKLKKHTPVAIVGSKNPNNEKETYTGFYFINI